MSGADNIFITFLERASSSDINNLQSLQARFMADTMRYLLQKRARGNFQSTDGFGVVAGMPVTASGTNVVVGEGVLMQYSTTLSPTPGALDSPWRMARNPSAVTVSGASPGSTSWYLLEAQMQNVVAATENREIWNPALQIFVSTPVTVQNDRTVRFQLTLGGTSIPLPSAGWVPIAGVQFPAGGGAPLAIVDMRPLPDVAEVYNVISRVEDSTFNTISTPTTPSNSIAINSIVAASQCGPLFSNPSLANVDVTASDVLSPGTVLTANSWYYLYLSPWSDNYIKPRNAAVSYRNEGVLVLSSIPPTAGKAYPTAAVPLPAPYANGTVTFSAEPSLVCVGALRRNTGNTGWVPSSHCAKRVDIWEPGVLEFLTPTTFNPSASGTANMTGFYPSNARRVRIGVLLRTPSPPDRILGADAFNLVLGGNTAFAPAYYRTMLAQGNVGFYDIDVLMAGPTFQFFAQNQSTAGYDSQISMYVAGWEY